MAKGKKNVWFAEQAERVERVEQVEQVERVERVEQVATKDYSNSGYDRGHMAPAADMKWSEQATKESFFTITDWTL